jgi:hypothetical protein
LVNQGQIILAILPLNFVDPNWLSTSSPFYVVIEK